MHIYIYIYIYIYQASPIIDLLCVHFYASFCENYAKHYFDANHLRGLIEYGVVKWSPFFIGSALFGQYWTMP